MRGTSILLLIGLWVGSPAIAGPAQEAAGLNAVAFGMEPARPHSGIIIESAQVRGFPEKMGSLIHHGIQPFTASVMQLGAKAIDIRQYSAFLKNTATLPYSLVMASYRNVCQSLHCGWGDPEPTHHSPAKADPEPVEEDTATLGRYHVAPHWSISPDLRMSETVASETLGASTHLLNNNGPQNGGVEKRVFMDLHFAYAATEDLDISLSLKNLTDEDAVEISSPVGERREFSGRFVGLGLNYRF